MAGINKKRYRVRARAPYSPSEFRSYARDVLFLPWFSNFKKIPSLRRKAWLIIFNECVIKIIYGSWKKGLDERSAMTYWAWDNLCPCTINRGEEMKSSWSDAIASCDTRESRHFANHAPLGNRVCGLQSKLFSARHENSLCTERTLRRPPPSLERKSLLRPVFVPPFFLIERSGEKEEGKKRGEEGKEEREKSSSITRFDSIESKKRREEKDRWNPDSYCIESQSLTGKKIETNPSNSIRVGSRGRNNGFSLHTPWKSIFDVQFQTQYQTLRIFTTCVIKDYRILDIPG